MALQELHIKNMVCDRCVRAVRHEIEQQGYVIHHLELGRASVERNLIDLPTLEAGLKVQGFDLLTDRNARLVNQIKSLIINLIQSGQVARLNITLSDYLSGQMAMDYTHLSHVFSSTEHLTIEKFWILQRVERAKELLSYRETAISEIAAQLGYSSLSYLSNQFKQITGLSPGAYRDLNAPDRNALDWI